MTDNILELASHPTPDQDIIAMLEDWVLLAKQGEFKEIALAAVCHKGGTRTGTAGKCSVAEMTGLLAGALFEYQRGLSVEDAEPPEEQEE